METVSLPNGVSEEDVVVLEKDSSCKCIVHLFGSTLISWIRKDVEHIYVSSTAKFDNKMAIRGGIPLVFPCFGPWPAGPQHGFARNSRWKPEKVPYADSDGNVTASFSLTENAETLKMWNYKFKLVYTVKLSSDSLQTSFAVENNGDAEFSFTCLLHTYFRVADITQATVSNLRGVTYLDKTQGGKAVVEDRDVLSIDRCVDYQYVNTPSTLEIRGLPGGAVLRMEKENFPDAVVWNPWVEKAAQMLDLDSHSHFLCVEAGHVVTPLPLPAGARWQASQTLNVMDAK